MITHYSEPTEAGYANIRIIRLPLILPQTKDNPRRQINKHDVITVVHLAELVMLPANKPSTLVDGYKYGEPQLVDGVVVAPVIAKTSEDIEAETKNAALIALQETDIDIPRAIEDLYDSVSLLGGQMSDELSDKIAAKKAARSAYLSLMIG